MEEARINSVCCLQCFGAAFQLVESGISSNLSCGQILICHADPSYDNNFIFQYDYNPKHTANAVKESLHRKTHSGSLSVMDWPPQSTHLNIIYKYREQKKSHSTSKEEH